MVESCPVRYDNQRQNAGDERYAIDSLQEALGVVPAALLREYVLGLMVLGLVHLSHVR